jgi:hypothetical protein
MKWIYRFFVVLGVIFFFILVGIGYFVIADPLNLRPIIMGMYEADKSQETNDASTTDNQTETEDAPATSNNTGVSDSQAQALESVGIDPQTVPAQFTDEQQKCFVGILGQERVDAIVAGDTPTPTEFYKAKSCL